MLYILLILLVLLMFMAFFEDYISERDRLWLFIGAAAVMTLVAGFRPDDVDKDYDNYIRYYYSFDITTEYTFILIANLIRFTIDNYIYVFAIYAALCMALIAYSIKNLSDLWLSSLLIYLSQYFILHCMTQIRVSVAAGFFLLALPFLFQRKIGKFLLTLLGAVSFHYSSIVYLFFFALTGKELKGKWLIFWSSLIPVCIVLFVMKISLTVVIPIPYLEEKLLLYEKLTLQGESMVASPFSIVQLARIALLYFFIWKSRVIAKHNTYIYLLIKIEILGICAFCLLANVPVLAFRVSEMICIVEVILYPLIIYTLHPRWIGKTCVIATACLLFVAYNFVNKILYL